MALCYQCSEGGRRPRSPMRRSPEFAIDPVGDSECVECGAVIDRREVLAERFSERSLGESPPLLVRDGQIVAG